MPTPSSGAGAAVAQGGRGALLALLVAAGCTWTRNPGPSALARAEGPVAAVSLPSEAETATLAVVVRAGSAHDPPGQEGLAWLTAQSLVQGGAGDRDPEAVAGALAAWGAALRVEVGRECVTFTATGPSAAAEGLAGLLGDALVAPRLDDAVLAGLKQTARAWLEALPAREPRLAALELLQIWLFEAHPYGHAPQGRAGVLDTLSAQDVRQFLANRYLRPAAAAGAIGAGASAALPSLQDRLGSLPPQLYRDVTPRFTGTVTGQSAAVVETGTAGSWIALGQPTRVGRAHPDWPALLLASAALQARLSAAVGQPVGAAVDEAREVPAGGQGLVQAPFAAWWPLPQPEQADASLAAGLEALRLFALEGPSPAELEAARAARLAWLDGMLADPGERLIWALEAAVHGDPDPLDGLGARLGALSLAEVNAALGRHLHPDDLRVVLLAGATSSRPVEESAATNVQAAAPHAVADQEPTAPTAPGYLAGVEPRVDLSPEDLFR